jgi:hypothetical protein
MQTSRQTQHNQELLVNRFQRFCQERALPVDDEASQLFAVGAGRKASTKLHYLATLQTFLHPKDPVARFRAGLRKIMALEPLHQATPITYDQLCQTLNRLSPRRHLLLWLAWKTASRLHEVGEIRRESFIALSQDELIIHWGAHTKTSANDPFKIQLLTVVAITLRDRILCPALHLIHRLQPQELLALPGDILNIRIALLKTDKNLSQHSIKRGALQHLNPMIQAGAISLHVIARLLKHQANADPIPQSTFRYFQDKTALARALGTQAATRHL